MLRGAGPAPGSSRMKRFQDPQKDRDREDHSGPGCLYPGEHMSVCTDGGGNSCVSGETFANLTIRMSMNQLRAQLPHLTLRSPAPSLSPDARTLHIAIVPRLCVPVCVCPQKCEGPV